jgi:hypothetical protein
MTDGISYYGLNGMKRNRLHKGINIVRRTINGSTKSYKVIQH